MSSTFFSFLLNSYNNLKFGVVSHGRTANIVANGVKDYAEIGHLMLAPVPGPWGKEEFIKATKATAALTQIRVGTEDFMALLGYGAAYKAEMRACLGAVGG